MKSTTAIIVIPTTDGFLDELVPEAGLLIEDHLENSGGLSSKHSRRAYLEDVRRFNEWRSDRPITKSLVEEYLQALAKAKTSPAYISRSLAGIRWYIRNILSADEGRSTCIDTPVLQQRESLWRYPSGYGSAFAD